MTHAIPRQPRLDAPETLHHVMVRGLERRVIFRDDADRDDLVRRGATLAYVWGEVLGRRANALGRAWGQTRGNVTWAAQRGAIQATRWQTGILQWCR